MKLTTLCKEYSNAGSTYRFVSLFACAISVLNDMPGNDAGSFSTVKRKFLTSRISIQFYPLFVNQLGLDLGYA